MFHSLRYLVAVVSVLYLAGAHEAVAQTVSSAQAQRMAALRQQQVARQRAVANQQVLARQQAALRAQQLARARAARGATAGVAARGATTAGGATGGVRSTASSASLGSLTTAINAFAADMGRVPTASEGLGALLNRPAGAQNWRGPYISSVNWHQALTDPWGSPYRYTVQGSGRYQTGTISSDGPDRAPGTADDLRVQF